MTKTLPFELHFVDIEPEFIATISHETKDIPNVFCHHADILDVAECCVVSPANSFGDMDGGIDKVYKSYFGDSIQDKVQDYIREYSPNGIAVGDTAIIATYNKRVPWLLVAPTMSIPRPHIDPVVAGDVLFSVITRAALNASSLKRVFCPGLGTGIGELDNEKAALEMSKAIKKWLEIQYQQEGH